MINQNGGFIIIILNVGTIKSDPEGKVCDSLKQISEILI